MQKKLFLLFALHHYQIIAEALLKQKYQNEYEIESYGIQPIAKADIPQIKKVFGVYGVKPQLHNPKRLNSSIISKSSQF